MSVLASCYKGKGAQSCVTNVKVKTQGLPVKRECYFQVTHENCISSISLNGPVRISSLITVWFM